LLWWKNYLKLLLMNKIMKNNFLIDIKSLSYSINWNNLIKNLSFDIYENQIISIIWYNGSWKSTLLQLLLWTLKPSSWWIIRKPWVRIWYVPQKLSFVQDVPLTVRDFLSIYNKSITTSSVTTCSLLDITPLLDTPLSWLSWGQIQKVLIYNALLWDPQLLLLDEPTAWLDVSAQKEFYALIEHIYQEHTLSIVLVSHDIHTVYSKSDIVVCLHNGLCCSWSPSDTWFSNELKDVFGGYVIPYLHTHDAHDR